MKHLTAPIAATVFAVALIGGAAPASAAVPANDTVGGAAAVAVPSSLTEETTQATTDATDAALNASCGAPQTAASVWFTVTAPPGAGGLVADVSASTGMNAGVIVATGAPGSLSLLACGPGAVAWPAAPGDTFYVMAFDDGTDGGGNGGTLEISFAPAPPPPTVTVTVDPVGYVDKQGVATITGTATCSDGDFVEIDGTLSQLVGRVRINGDFVADTACSGTQQWSTQVFAPNGKFAGGKAATVSFAFACNIAFCSEYDSTQAIKLRGTRR